MISKERLDEIRKLCDEASKGPWYRESLSHADLKVLAASRQIIPELLSEIELLQIQLSTLKRFSNSNEKDLWAKVGKLRAVAEAAEKYIEYSDAYFEGRHVPEGHLKWLIYHEALKVWRGEE